MCQLLRFFAYYAGIGTTFVSADAKVDVAHQLRLNCKDIEAKCAAYIRCIKKSLTEKNVSAKDLCSFLLVLLKDHQSLAAKIEKAMTLEDIFIDLEKYFSFWDYDIFERLLVEYDLDKQTEKLQYNEYFESYIQSHKVSEFVEINPLLTKYQAEPDSKQVVLKFDVDIAHCDQGKVYALKEIVATSLNIRPSTLRLLKIEEGCMEVTVLIPTPIADEVFTSEWEQVSEQSEELKAASVLSITCNDSTFRTMDEKLVPAEDTKITTASKFISVS